MAIDALPLAYWLPVIFVLGAAIGSFLNVCIYRLPLEKSIIWPRVSYCGHCYQPIGWYAVALGVLAGGSILASNVFSEALEKTDGSGRRAYAGAGGFDLDDLLYLMGPAAWLGWLWPILVGAAIVSPVMALLTLWRLQRVKRRR